jgi:putative ABC transport system permease protein
VPGFGLSAAISTRLTSQKFCPNLFYNIASDLWKNRIQRAVRKSGSRKEYEFTMSNLKNDLSYGLRLLIKNPGFSAVAVLTLALGTGVTTAIFSLVNGILLRPLPFPQSERLVRVLQAYPEKGLDSWRLSQANFAAYRDQSSVFSSIAAYATTGMNLTGIPTPERLQAAKVTGDFFKVLGVDPMIGRSFGPEEDVPGKNHVCVLSYGFWQRHFSGDRNVIGKSLILNNASTDIIGIMPASFGFPVPETEVWTPIALNSQASHPFFLTGIARLKPGVQVATAQSETTGIMWRTGQQNPHMVARDDPPPPGAGLRTSIVPLKEAIVGKTEKPLLVLQFAVIFILLIACANVANLLLSRTAVRDLEIAVRSAIGAQPRRVIQQLLTESILLALLGATPGIALAWGAVRTLNHLPLAGVPRLDEVSLSAGVLLFTVFIALLTGVLFGLAPIFYAYRSLKAGLTEGQRGSSMGSGRWLNRSLVAAQFALSLVLLIGAGLVLRSFRELLGVNPGFQANNVLTMLLPVTNQKYPNPPQAVEFYHNLLDQMRNLPGVTAAGASSNLPFSGEESYDGYIVEGHEPPPGSEPTQAQLQTVTPGYFQALGISLLRGRDISDADQEKTPMVVVVDETLARRYWPDGDALGKRVRTTGDPTWFTIVAVVNGIKDQNMAEDRKPHIYFAHGQDPQLRMYLALRTGDPAALSSTVRRKIHELDGDVPVYAVRTMSEVVDKTLISQKLTDLLLTAFATLALILAAIGVYGVMSVYVTGRTREFGIRLAIGAKPANLLVSVLKQGFVLVLAGIAVGLFGAFILTRAISSLLFNVSPTDPAVFLGIPLLLILVAFPACYWPARRAARTNPLTALRYE